MTQVSAGAAIFAIVMGLSNPLVGTLFARWGARTTMLTGATLLALTSLGYASLQNLAMLYAIMMVAGFAVASSTVLPAQTLVTNWFDRFRGRAMGVTMLGIGAGGFLLPPLNELMIRPARMAAHLGRLLRHPGAGRDPADRRLRANPAVRPRASCATGPPPAKRRGTESAPAERPDDQDGRRHAHLLAADRDLSAAAHGSLGV